MFPPVCACSSLRYRPRDDACRRVHDNSLWFGHTRSTYTPSLGSPPIKAQFRAVFRRYLSIRSSVLAVTFGDVIWGHFTISTRKSGKKCTSNASKHALHRFLQLAFSPTFGLISSFLDRYPVFFQDSKCATPTGGSLGCSLQV